jgi:cytochrome c-type biogenesis protein CcmH
MLDYHNLILMSQLQPMKKLAILLLLLPITVFAIDKHPIEFSNTTQESRYQQLIDEFRCVVCQNQSVADSNADLAQDVRDIVRNMVLQGKTDKEISAFLVERYGDFVLYNPPVKPITYLLWLGPLALLFIALMALVYIIRRHAVQTAQPIELTAEETQKIQQLLTSEPKK